MRAKKKFCCIAMVISLISSMVVLPSVRTNAIENRNVEVVKFDGNINTLGLQADITFPDHLNYVDDTLIINNIYI